MGFELFHSQQFMFTVYWPNWFCHHCWSSDMGCGDCTNSFFSTDFDNVRCFGDIVAEISKSIQQAASRKQSNVALIIQIVIITATNIICWVPSGATFLSSIFMDQYPTDLMIWVTIVVAPPNSYVNPLVFVATCSRKILKHWINTQCVLEMLSHHNSSLMCWQCIQCLLCLGESKPRSLEHRVNNKPPISHCRQTIISHRSGPPWSGLTLVQITSYLVQLVAAAASSHSARHDRIQDSLPSGEVLVTWNWWKDFKVRTIQQAQICKSADAQGFVGAIFVSRSESKVQIGKARWKEPSCSLKKCCKRHFSLHCIADSRFESDSGNVVVWRSGASK